MEKKKIYDILDNIPLIFLWIVTVVMCILCIYQIMRYGPFTTEGNTFLILASMSHIIYKDDLKKHKEKRLGTTYKRIKNEKTGSTGITRRTERGQ